MSKEVQMSIKIERELRDEFARAAAAVHRPASQVMRELMRSFISSSHEPNAESIQAMREVEEGKVFHTQDLEDFRRQLGI
jgi:predicted transcriptional regulator